MHIAAHGYNVFQLTVHLKLYCLTALSPLHTGQMSTIKAKIITAIRSKRTAREGVATRYFMAITVDQRLTQFTMGATANIESLKHVVPDAFLVFSGFHMASRGDQTFVTITKKTKV